MLGSWAGAMGQTQFMPSSFMKFAVDGNRDGVRDIWSSVPDAMASTANYLRQHGWQPGLPWGFEVALPQGFDFRHLKQDFARWQAVGLRRMDGKAMPRAGEATLFLPGGAGGPAFLVTDNYDVIKAYNSSDAYAMGVAHLGDRLLGGSPIQGAWPKDEPMLDRDQRQELQERLARLGFYEGDAGRQARLQDPGGRAELPAQARLDPRRLCRLCGPARIARDPLTEFPRRLYNRGWSGSEWNRL